MKHIPLKISGFVQPNDSNSSCYVILKEQEGERQLVMKIGLHEAECIIMALENIRTNTPVIHDLFYNLASIINLSIKEILLDVTGEKVQCRIVFVHEKLEIEIPSRTCDAMALAIRFNSPVVATEKLLEEVAVEGFDALDKAPEKLKSKSDPQDLTGKNDADLNQMLKDSIDEENYELAGKIRDELLNRKKPVR